MRKGVLLLLLGALCAWSPLAFASDGIDRENMGDVSIYSLWKDSNIQQITYASLKNPIWELSQAYSERKSTEQISKEQSFIGPEEDYSSMMATGFSSGQIGSGPSTSSYMPIYSYYSYNYSQQIYLSSELQDIIDPGDNYITTIRFRQFNAGTPSNYNNWTVFMGNTTKSSFSGNADWVPYSDLTQVFIGELSFAIGQWIDIELDTPFYWDGVSNLVIGVDENSPGWSSSSFYSFPSGSNRGLLYYSDSTNPNPESPPTGNYGPIANIAQIQIEAVSDISCLPPRSIEAVNVTTNSIDVSWEDINSTNTWKIEYGETGFTLGNGTTVSGIQTKFHTLTGLTPDTNYDIYLQSECGSDGVSAWNGPVSIKTLIPGQIGEGDDSSAFLPIYSYYVYNYSQQIYLANELQAVLEPGKPLITTIRFKQINAGTPGTYDNWTVYLGNTSKSAFDNASDWVPITEMSNVFSGTLTFAANSWVEIELDRPFHWDGVSNLVVAVDENSPGLSQSSFQSFNSGSNRGMLLYTDTYNPDPLYLSNASYGPNANIAQIQIVSESAPSCLSPSGIYASNINANSANIGWTEHGSASQWEIEYGAKGFTLGTGTRVTDVNSNPYNLSLELGERYDIYVRSVCSSVDKSIWEGPFVYEYCQVSVTNTSYFINEISSSRALSDISYTTSTFPVNSYSDQTSQTFEVFESQEFEINTVYNVTNSHGIGIWVDWNHDMVFDSSELLASLYSSGNEKTISLTIPPGTPNGVYRMRVRANNSSSYTPCGNVNYGSTVDFNLTVTNAPSCIRPYDLTVSDRTLTSAMLGWIEEAGGNATSWNVEYGISGYTQGQGTLITNIATESYNLQGLTPDTTYDFYVQSDCATEGQSTWEGPYTFKTLVPGQIGDGDDSGVFFPLYAYYNYNYSQQIYLADEMQVVLEPGNTFITKIRFKQVNSGNQTSYNNWTVYLGNTTKSSFSTVSDWVPFSELSQVFSGELTFAADTWVEIELVNPFNWDGTSNLVVAVDENSPGYSIPSTSSTFASFNSGSNRGLLYFSDSTNPDPQSPPSANMSMSNSVDIAQIQIEAEPTPSCLPPTDLTTTGITYESAIADWIDHSNATSWNVEYGEAGFILGQGTRENNLSSTSFQFTNLNQNTEYEYYVQANCGGEESVWVKSLPFITFCGFEMAPWTYDVEDQSATTNNGLVDLCWIAEPSATNLYSWGVTGTGTVGISSTAPNSAHSGTKYFFVRSNYGSIGTTADLHTPLVDVSSLTTPYLEFHYHRFGVNMGDLYVEISEDDGTTWNTIGEIKGNQHATANEAWIKEGYPLSVQSNTVKARFRAVHAGYYGAMAIDDISIKEAPSCIKPQDLKIDSLFSDEVTISWESSASNAVVKYQAGSNFDPDTQGQLHNVNNQTETTITGLSSETAYYVYVKAECGSSDESDWSGPLMFTTPCSPVTAPWLYTVEEQSGTTVYSVVGDCWTASPVTSSNAYAWAVSGTGVTAMSSTGPNSAHSGTKFFYTRASYGVAGDVAELISPLIDVSGISVPHLEYYYHRFGSSMGDMNVEVSDDGGISWTIVASYTGQEQTNGDEDWIKESIPLGGYGQTLRVKFTGIRGSGMYGDMAIDDISITGAPDCISPTELTLESVGIDQATISWMGWGDPEGFNVAYGLADTMDINDSNTYLIQNVSNSTNPLNATITNLTPNSEYMVYVQTDCGNGDHSVWIGPLQFCLMTTVPYVEDFESVTPPNLPECTAVVSAINNNSWQTISYSNSYGFSGKLLRYSYSSYLAADSWFFTKGIYLEAGETYMISYRYGGTGTNYEEKMKVMYGTAQTVAGMTEELMDYQSIAVGTPQEAEHIFTVPATDYYFFGFHAYSDANKYYLHIDDIEIDLAPNCIRPVDLVVDTITENSAEITWTEQASATQWEVAYGKAGFNIETADPNDFIVVNGNPEVTLTGLDYNTNYDVYVRSDCGNDGTSEWILHKASFKTDCQPGDIPFFDGFEIGQVNNQVLECWTHESVSGTSKWQAYNGTVSTRAPRTGSWNAVLYTSEAWMFYPIELQAGNTYELELYARQQTASRDGRISVSYGLEDNVAAMTETVISETDPLPASYEKYNGYISPAATGTYYIGIRGLSPSGGYYLAIDDLAVNPASGCFIPTDPVASAVTENSAHISWTPQGDATQWEVVYGVQGFDVEDAQAGTSIIVNDDPETSITGLDYNTNYDVYVRSLCNGTESEWAHNVARFKTDCQPGDIPFFDGFEIGQVNNQVLECWTHESVSGTSKWQAYNGTVSTRAPRTGSWNAVLYTSEAWMFYPLELQAGNTYELELYARQQTASRDGRISVSYGLEDNIAAMTETVISETDPLPASYEKYNGYISPAATGTYYIGIRGLSPSGGYYLAIDDLAVNPASGCFIPTDPVASAITENSAHISWTPQGDATQWEVVYGVQGFDVEDAQAGTSIIVNDDPETSITGLDYNTNYDVYVRSLCNGTESEWAHNVARFKTDCQPGDIPFFDGFEIGQVNNQVLECWTHESVSGASKWQAYNGTVSTRAPRTGSWNAVLYTSEAWMFYPLELQAGNTYELELYARQQTASRDGRISVSYGLEDNVAAMTETVISETDPLPASYEKYNGYISPATTGTYYIGIRGFSPSGGYYLAIDDLAVNPASGCFIPTDPVASAVTNNSAHISWTPQGDATQWEVVYGVSGFNVEDTNAGTSVIVNDTPETILVGLDYNTAYDVYVRSVCDGGVVSDWALNNANFKTECQDGNIPFFDSFEIGQKHDQNLECWTSEIVRGSQGWIAWDDDGLARTGNWSTRINTNHEVWLFYPLDLQANVTYELELYARTHGLTGAVEAAYGVSNNSLAMVNTIFENSEVINADYQRFNGYLTPDTTATYYIGIKGTSATNTYRLYMDDISVNEAEGCFYPKDLTVDTITDESASISWVEQGTATQWEVVYGSTNFNPDGNSGSSVIVNGNPSTTLVGLDSNAAYDVYVRSVCSEDTSEWVGPAKFTTDCYGYPTLSFVGGQGVFGNSIISPLSGTPETTFQFAVIYTNEQGDFPPYGFPRVLLDYEGNGNFNNTNDRAVILMEAEPEDQDTTDGKLYVGSISQLPSGTNWEAWVQVQSGTCTTEFGPFNVPEVLIAPDLEIFANDISFDNPNPDVSSPLQVTATIHNRSDLPAENFVVHLENQYDRDEDYGDIIIEYLGAHESTNVVWNITTPAEPSWNPMEVFVDYTNEIHESNELNNRAIRPFTNGDYNLPGAINVQASVSPTIVYLPSGLENVHVSGYAYYTDTAVQLQDSTVAGATVTFISPVTGSPVMTHTDSRGYFSFSTKKGTVAGVYTAPVEVTDFTITGEKDVTWELIPGPCLPDLSTQMTINRSQIFPGESVDGVITVKNRGCAAVEVPTLLEVMQTGGLPLIQNVTVPPLEPGESFVYNFSDIVFDQLGTYYIYAFADAESIVVESSEGNNNASRSVNVVPPLPDITPGGGPTATQYICNQAYPSFTIRNIGYKKTDGFEYTVDVYHGGNLLETYTQSVNNIEPGHSVGVSVPFEYPNLGTYTFVLSCDVPIAEGGVVSEISETNNVATYTRTMIACQPDLIVRSTCHSLVVDPVDVEIPGTVTYTATVFNGGNATANGPIEFEFLLTNGESYPLVHNDDLLPGQEIVFSTQAPAVESGSVDLIARVDPNNLVAESNENNNSTSGTLCWEFEPVPLCTGNFWGGTYHEHESTTLRVGLKARHLYRASEVKVRFEVSGPGISGWALLGDAVVENVRETCSCPYAATLPTPFVFNESGVYTFRMTADPDNEYSECNEGNNVLIKDVIVTNRPDMRILSQHINPTLLNPDPGQNIFFDVSYENIGYSNIDDRMDLKILINDQEHAVVNNVPGLITGQTTTISIPVPFSSHIEGLHVVRAIIDPERVTNDRNWLNNEATRSFIVGAAANLYFEEFYASNQTPEIGELIDIEALVKNSGEIDIEAQVMFSYISAVGDTISIGNRHVSLTPGGSQQVTLPWTVLQNPTTILGEIINSSELESDYTDNFASTNLSNFVVSITSVEACEDQNLNGSLTASATNGTAPYTYTWSTGFIGETLEAPAGTYTVTVVDADGQSATATGVIEEDPDCIVLECSLSAVSFNIPPSCNSDTGVYTTTLVVAYENAPENGFIVVNGVDHPITGSPQSISVDFYSGLVTYEVSFSDDSGCALIVPTGQVLEECELDCEGVYGGTAVPGSACEDANGAQGFYDDDCQCELIPTCVTPTDLYVTNITYNSAQVGWTENGLSTSWNIEFGPAGFTQGEGVMINGVTTNPYTLTNLTSDFEYEFYVQPVCDEGDGDWAGPHDFVTPCTPVTVPYFEGFETVTLPNIPECTYAENLGSGNIWETAAIAANGFDSNVLRYLGNENSASTVFYTRGLVLEAGKEYEFSYKYGNDSTIYQETLQVLYGTTRDSYQMSLLADHQIITGGNAYVDEMTITVPTSGVYYFAFHAYSSAEQGSLYVDDISVKEASQCFSPVQLYVMDVTKYSAEVAWIEIGIASQWNIEYGVTGFEPGSGTLLEGVTTNPYMLTGLEPGTTYDVFIQSDCGDEMSLWEGPLTFTTEELYCGPHDVPYYLDIETEIDCIAFENNGSGADWEMTNQAASGFSGYYLAYNGDNLNDADAWFYTPGVKLMSNVVYKMSYKYGSSGGQEKMKVVYGTYADPNFTLVETLADHNNITTSPETNTFTFTVASDGVYHFGFHAYSGASNSRLMVDDISITYDGYVWMDEVWTPEHPNLSATQNDNVVVVNGYAFEGSSIYAPIDINNLTVLPEATLEVESILNVHGNLTIKDGGDLVFASGENFDGELGLISGDIIGEATVQRYMMDRRSFRMVSSAVTTTTTIRDNWQEGVNNSSTSNNQNPNPGFGTHITGSTSGTNGFDATETGAASMFVVDIQNQQFVPIDNTNSNIMNAGDTYMLFVRGDRGIDLNDNDSHSETVLRAKGTLKKGDAPQAFPDSDNGRFVMIGNPYQSSVNMETVLNRSTNVVSSTYYVYDPKLATYGSYVSYTFGGVGVSNNDSEMNEYLQPGQGAQIETLAPGAIVLFTEDDKAPGHHTSTNAAPISDMLSVQLYTTENFNTGGPSHDGIKMVFDNSYSNELTRDDVKMPFNFYENLGRDYNGTYLSIEFREMPVADEVYPLYTSGYSYSDYTLKLTLDGIEDAAMYLDDHFTGASTLLSNGETSYRYTLTDDPLSEASDRFSIRVEGRLDVEHHEVFSGIHLFPNPLTDHKFYISVPKLNGELVNVSISDVSGRVMYQDNLECISNRITVDTSENLASGVYMVTLRHGEVEYTLRLVKE